MCEPYYGDRVIAWPVGIATDEWIPSSSKDKDIDFLLNSEDFAARDYILENLTLEKCAQNYLDILFSQQ